MCVCWVITVCHVDLNDEYKSHKTYLFIIQQHFQFMIVNQYGWIQFDFKFIGVWMELNN